MKLLIVCPDWFPFSAGLAQSCLEFCRRAGDAGHEVRVIVAKDPGLQDKGQNIIPIRYLFRLGGRSPIVLNYWHKIKKHIRWSDKIILYSYMYEMNSRIVIYRKLGLFNKPLIHMYRGSLENEVLRNVSWLTRIFKRLWDATFGRLMFTAVDLTISNSKPTIDLIGRRYGAENAVYVPSAIDVDEFVQSSQNTKRLLFIGRLVENKGIKLFASIVEALPSGWEFAIVGDGPLKSLILELAENNDAVKYYGKIPFEKTKELLGNSSLLVLPSYAEGSPRAVLEAMASRVVPISFEVGDVSSVIDEDTGVKVDMRRPDLLCQAVTRLAEDERLRGAMAGKALMKARREYDWKVVYAQLSKEMGINE